MPRTGPLWMRFMRCCEHRQQSQLSIVAKLRACTAARPAGPVERRLRGEGGGAKRAAACPHRGEASDLVPEALRLDDRHLLAHALVGVEIQRQPVVILLDDDPAGLLYRLRANAPLHAWELKGLSDVPSSATLASLLLASLHEQMCRRVRRRCQAHHAGWGRRTLRSAGRRRGCFPAHARDGRPRA